MSATRLFEEVRWGHGRSLQLLRRRWCAIAGHEWGEGVHEPSGPGGFTIIRRCAHLCGALHVTTMCYDPDVSNRDRATI